MLLAQGGKQESRRDHGIGSAFKVTVTGDQIVPVPLSHKPREGYSRNKDSIETGQIKAGKGLDIVLPTLC